MTWQPNWNDVHFNRAAADQAASALHAAARRLDDQAARRAALVADADAQWRGGHRDVWFDTYERLRADAADLASRLRANASRINAASDAAVYEQALREQQRSDWLRLQEIQRQREAAALVEAHPSPIAVSTPQHVGLL